MARKKKHPRRSGAASSDPLSGPPAPLGALSSSTQEKDSLSSAFSQLVIADGPNDPSPSSASRASDIDRPAPTTTPSSVKPTYASVLNASSSRCLPGAPLPSGTSTASRPWDGEKQRLPVERERMDDGPAWCQHRTLWLPRFRDKCPRCREIRFTLTCRRCGFMCCSHCQHKFCSKHTQERKYGKRPGQIGYGSQ